MIDGMDVMDSEVISQAETDERILTFDVPDEALERAVSAEQQAFTVVVLHLRLVQQLTTIAF
jgi:hypothetical protein